MKSISIFFLFIIVILITIEYSNHKFNKNKERIIVREIALPTSFYDFFKPQNLASNFSYMFETNETNSINFTEENTSTSKENEKNPFVPQRFFVNI